jgi:hypothetical protein
MQLGDPDHCQLIFSVCVHRLHRPRRHPIAACTASAGYRTTLDEDPARGHRGLSVFRLAKALLRAHVERDPLGVGWWAAWACAGTRRPTSRACRPKRARSARKIGEPAAVDLGASFLDHYPSGGSCASTAIDRALESNISPDRAADPHLETPLLSPAAGRRLTALAPRDGALAVTTKTLLRERAVDRRA